MKREHNKQQGFTWAILIIFAVLIALTGFIAWRIWAYHPGVATQMVRKADSKTSSDQTMYLRIKELGIKLPLTTDVSDLIYTTTQHDDSSYSIHFSTSSIVAADPSCAPDADPLGLYVAYPSQQSNEWAGDFETQVNGYYLYYKHVQFACGFGNEATTTKVNAAIDTLPKIIQKAQKD